MAGVVVTQVFFSTLIGGAAYWRRGRIHSGRGCASRDGSAAGSFLGGVASKWFSEWFLLFLFGVVTFFVGAMMFLPGPPADREEIAVEKVTVPFLSLSLLSVVIGVVIGFLGARGGSGATAESPRAAFATSMRRWLERSR